MKKFMQYKEEIMKQKNKRIVNSSKSLATVRERERERAILKEREVAMVLLWWHW